MKEEDRAESWCALDSPKTIGGRQLVLFCGGGEKSDFSTVSLAGVDDRRPGWQRKEGAAFSNPYICN